MKDIMIATGNKNKVVEFKELLEPLGYTVHDLSEVEHTDVEENGTTFAENALIKARGAKDCCDMICIADDSGISINHFGGKPGIYSARWLAPHDYPYKHKYIIENMADATDRGAHYTCAIAIIDEEGEHVFVGELHGSVAFKPKGEFGFGYDPIFIPEGYNITTAEMTAAEKNAISHRGKATKMLVDYLKGK